MSIIVNSVCQYKINFHKRFLMDNAGLCKLHRGFACHLSQEAVIYCMVYATFADMDEAQRIAQLLLEEKLAACVNIFPAITSIYRWQGKIEQQQEVVALIKTGDWLYEDVKSKISERHSYDTCCVLKIPLSAGSAKFLRWIDNSVKNLIDN